MGRNLAGRAALFTGTYRLRQKHTPCIQLFRQRLSQKSVKAYATMPIGIMGRKNLALINWLRFTMFTNKKREGINTFVCAVSRYVAETSKASIPITHNTFRHCRARFCWTTFLETAVNYRLCLFVLRRCCDGFTSKIYLRLMQNLSCTSGQW